MNHKRSILSSAMAILLCLSLTLPVLASSSYTVQKGDCLWKIAKSQMGDGNRWTEIYEANRSTISDPSKIYPGQVLVIPTDDDTDNANEADEVTDAAIPTNDADVAGGVNEVTDAVEEAPAAYRLETANSYSEVMKRHASISAQGVEYIGGEAKPFTLFGNDEMLYIGSEAYQRLTMDGKLLLIEDGKLYMTTFMTEGDYQQAVDESKNYFKRTFDAAKWIEATEEEQAFSVVTELDDAEEVANTLEGFGYDAAEGAVLVMNYRYDREDLDLLGNSVTARYADGTERLLAKTEFAYDTGEMDLMASPFAEYFGGKQFQLTITSDPGMPLLEQTRTFTTSKCYFYIICNGYYVDNYYTDADCTQLYEGRAADDYSDLHLYINSGFTAPGEEQQELFQRAAEKNTTADMLSRHETLSSEASFFCDGAPFTHFTRYVDNQRGIFADEAGFGTYVEPSEGRLFLIWDDGEYGLLLEDNEESVDLEYESLCGSMGVDFFEGSELLYTNEFEGELCFVYSASEATAREFYQGAVEAYGLPEDGFQDGMTLLCYQYLDSETLDLYALVYYLVEADGTRHLSYMEYADYDYDYRYENTPFAPFFETEASRSITLIFDPGTAEEKTVRTSQPAGMFFYVMYQGEYVDTLYTDPGCTQLYAGGDGASGGSVTLYYKALPGGAEK